MIEQLLRYKETIFYQANTSIKLIHNDESEGYPLHWHSSYEIICPMDGGYTVLCNGAVYELSEFDLLIIASGVMHQIVAPSNGSRYILQFELSPHAYPADTRVLLHQIPSVIHLTNKETPKLYTTISKVFQSIVSEYYSDSCYKETMIYSKLLTMFTLIARAKYEDISSYHQGNQKELEYYHLYLIVCDYIHTNFHKTMTLEEVSTYAGFSKYHFAKIFRYYAGVTFYQYLTQIRIEHATSLLLDTNHSIQEISVLCGFHNLSAFIRMFKLHTTMTPSEYKNRPMQS